MYVIGLEGACCSGKSTMSIALRKHFGADVAFITPDYSDLTEPQSRPTTLAKTFDEAVTSFEFYLNIERQRLEQVRSWHGSIVIVDRTYHTLLAHAYAVDSISNIESFEDLKRLSDGAPRVEPNQIIYLDAPRSILIDRAKLRSPDLPLVFHHEVYLETTQHYFKNMIKDVTPIVVDSSASPDRTVASAIKYFKVK